MPPKCSKGRYQVTTQWVSKTVALTASTGVRAGWWREGQGCLLPCQVQEGARGTGLGLNCLVVWVSLSSLRVESYWAGVLLSVHGDTAGEGKVQMIHLGKEGRHNKINKPSLDVGRGHRRVWLLSTWPPRADCSDLNPSCPLQAGKAPGRLLDLCVPQCSQLENGDNRSPTS